MKEGRKEGRMKELRMKEWINAGTGRDLSVNANLDYFFALAFFMKMDYIFMKAN